MKRSLNHPKKVTSRIARGSSFRGGLVYVGRTRRQVFLVGVLMEDGEKADILSGKIVARIIEFSLV